LAVALLAVALLAVALLAVALLVAVLPVAVLLAVDLPGALFAPAAAAGLLAAFVAVVALAVFTVVLAVGLVADFAGVLAEPLALLLAVPAFAAVAGRLGVAVFVAATVRFVLFFCAPAAFFPAVRAVLARSAMASPKCKNGRATVRRALLEGGKNTESPGSRQTCHSFWAEIGCQVMAADPAHRYRGVIPCPPHG
jgi:hypothetical protein